MSITKSYSELIEIPTFKERFEYLKIGQQVCDITFGSTRWLNQVFYKSPEWKRLRNYIIVRDNACDLAMKGHEILGGEGWIKIMIHHINPITEEDILNRSSKLLDPENLVTTILNTHNAIHYGDISQLIDEPIIRKPNDTCPWRH